MLILDILLSLLANHTYVLNGLLYVLIKLHNYLTRYYKVYYIIRHEAKAAYSL